MPNRRDVRHCALCAGMTATHKSVAIELAKARNGPYMTTECANHGGLLSANFANRQVKTFVACHFATQPAYAPLLFGLPMLGATAQSSTVALGPIPPPLIPIPVHV